jgi:glucuronide carrier protein
MAGDEAGGLMPAAHQNQTASGVKPVVTIFEAYGAGATTIGRKVAEKLGLPFHTQAFSSELIAGEVTDAATDDQAVLARVFSVLGGAYGGLEGRDIIATQQAKFDLITENNQTVWRFADEGGVIVGRNGAVILANRPNTLHVLLTGGVEDRVARAAGELGISVEQAAARRAREEDIRVQMSKTLYGWDPSRPDHYDMVINTTRITHDAAANAIVDAVRLQAA